MIEVDANQVVARLCDQISAQARQIAVLQAQIQPCNSRREVIVMREIRNLDTDPRPGGLPSKHLHPHVGCCPALVVVA